MLFIYFCLYPLCGSDWWDLEISWQLRVLWSWARDIRVTFLILIQLANFSNSEQNGDEIGLHLTILMSVNMRPGWYMNSDIYWYKACGWELGSRSQSNSLCALSVPFSELSEQWKILYLRTSWVYFCLSVFAASIWCIRSFLCFQKCLLKCFQYLPADFHQMTWSRHESSLCISLVCVSAPKSCLVSLLAVILYSSIYIIIIIIIVHSRKVVAMKD